MDKITRVIFSANAEMAFKLGKPRSMWLDTCDDVRREIALYISAHESAGIHFDTELQTIFYNDRVAFLLHKEDGFWIITDMIVLGAPAVCLPVFIWRKVRFGLRTFAARIFCGWRIIRARQDTYDRVG